jgi:hypothetical protein
MMIPVQVATSKKAVIIATFIFRVLSIAATITLLFYIHPATVRSPDKTFDAVNYNIVTLCVLSLASPRPAFHASNPSLTASSQVLWVSLLKTACLEAPIAFSQ